MAVDLGSRTTKAVLLERRGEVLALTRYALLDAPIYEKKMSPELLADHLRQVSEALGNTTKSLTLTVGLDDVIVRQVELPQIPMDEMRLVLKNNAKGYLQQDLPNHVFRLLRFSTQSARRRQARRGAQARRHAQTESVGGGGKAATGSSIFRPRRKTPV